MGGGKYFGAGYQPYSSAKGISMPLLVIYRDSYRALRISSAVVFKSLANLA